MAIGPGTREDNCECKHNHLLVANPPVCYSLIALKDEIDCQHLSVKKRSHILSARPRERQRAGTAAINLVPNCSQAKKTAVISSTLQKTKQKKQPRRDEMKKEVKPGRKKNAIFCEGKQTLSEDT